MQAPNYKTGIITYCVNNILCVVLIEVHMTIHQELNCLINLIIAKHFPVNAKVFLTKITQPL